MTNPNINKIKNIFDINTDYQLKIGVMGSASGYLMRNKKTIDICQKVGQEIAKNGYILTNGACPGLPDEAAKGAKKEGGTVFGFSPAISIRSHIDKYKSPYENYDQIFFTGLGLMERDIINIRASNAVVILPGGTGTLNEFTVAYDEGKPMGILTGHDGVADHIKDILKFCHREVTNRMIFSDNPTELITKLISITKSLKVPSRLDSYLIGEEGIITELENQIEIS